MSNTFKVSYVTTLPKEANAPSVSIEGNNTHVYKVIFSELINGIKIILKEGYCANNQSIISNIKQWFTNWVIEIFDEENNIVFEDTFNPVNKTVFIKIDSYALGDTIAWIPYIDKFRELHNCHVICSSFHNDILSDEYPNLLFVEPNIVIKNIYAQYYIGASNSTQSPYSPILVNEHPLQKVASSILGLEDIELRPDLTHKLIHIKPRIEGKYVTLSEFGSSQVKSWSTKNGWQEIVNILNDIGYKVVVISKEKTTLKNVIDRAGNYHIDERIIDIMGASFHIGISSGLSWLAWGLKKYVILISDMTPVWHEFKRDITRISCNDLKSVNYLIENQSTVEDVVGKVSEVGKLRYLL